MLVSVHCMTVDLCIHWCRSGYSGCRMSYGNRLDTGTSSLYARRPLTPPLCRIVMVLYTIIIMSLFIKLYYLIQLKCVLCRQYYIHIRVGIDF